MDDKTKFQDNIYNIKLLKLMNEQWFDYIKKNPEIITVEYLKILRLFKGKKKETFRALVIDDVLEAGASISINKNYMLLCLLIKSPLPNRKKGSGTVLLSRIVKEALNRKLNHVLIKSIPSALSFYLERGFQIRKYPERDGWDFELILKKKDFEVFLNNWENIQL